MPLNSVDPASLKAWLESRDAVLIDVREPSEHWAESIPGAHLLPLREVSVQKLPQLEGKKIAILCRTGRRSRAACERLAAQNPSLDLYNLEGGIQAWKAAGLPVSSRGFHLSLDQQVQITIGTGVLLGTILGYAISPYFLLLSGFFGLGLLYAGLTGSCALAGLLARMPWNQ